MLLFKKTLWLLCLTVLVITAIISCEKKRKVSPVAEMINKSWGKRGGERAKLLQEAIALSKTNMDSLNMAKATYFLGFYYQNTQDYALADSLFRISLDISEQVSDVETEISALNNLGQVLTFKRELVEASKILDQALLKSQRDEHDRLRGFVNFSRGILFDKSSELQKSIDEFKLALSSFSRFENYSSKIQTLNYLGIQHAQLGLFNLSSDYYLLAASEALEHADSSQYISSLYQSGINLIQNGDNKQAIYQSRKALLLLKKKKDIAKYTRILNNMGDAYSGLYEEEKNNAHFDSARFFIEESLDIKTEIGDQTGRAYSLYNLGRLMAAIEPDKAEHYLQEAYAIWKENEDWSKLSEVSLELARHYVSTPFKALDYLKLSDSLSLGNSNIPHKIAVLSLRADIAGRNKEVENQVKILLEKDSLQEQYSSLEKQKNIAATSVKLENVELSHQNQLLIQEGIYQERLNSSRNLGFAILGLALLLVGTFLFLLKQQNAKLFSLNSRLKNLKDTILHSQANSINLITALLRLQEKKSKLKAEREMLNQVNNRITALGGLTRLLYQEQIDSETGKEFVNLQSYLNEIIDETLVSVERGNLKLTVDLVDIDLLTNISLPIGLIINELLLNFLKYSLPFGGDCLKINSYLQNKCLIIQYQDNGPGFDPVKFPEKIGFGTQMIRTLTHDLKGETACFSESGLSYIFKIPT